MRGGKVLFLFLTTGGGADEGDVPRELGPVLEGICGETRPPAAGCREQGRPRPPFAESGAADGGGAGHHDLLLPPQPHFHQTVRVSEGGGGSRDLCQVSLGESMGPSARGGSMRIGSRVLEVKCFYACTCTCVPMQDVPEERRGGGAGASPFHHNTP